MMRNVNLQSGVTLIEVLIYITILGFIMTGALMSVYQILSGSDSLAHKNITEDEAGFIIAKISWALNDVSTINIPSAPNTSSGTLMVTKDSQTIEFALSGNDITVKKGSSAAIVINSDRVEMASLSFDFIQNTGTSIAKSIRASFYANDKYFETYRFIR